MASPVGYQLSLEDSGFVDTWLPCFAVSARTKKLKYDKEKGRRKWDYGSLGYSRMGGDNESLHHGLSCKPDFWKNKWDHKKYEAQEKVGQGWKNEVHVDETRNWRSNHKISTLSTKCE